MQEISEHAQKYKSARADCSRLVDGRTSLDQGGVPVIVLHAVDLVLDVDREGHAVEALVTATAAETARVVGLAHRLQDLQHTTKPYATARDGANYHSSNIQASWLHRACKVYLRHSPFP